MTKHRNIGWLVSELAYRNKDPETKSFRDVVDFIEDMSDAISTGQPFTVPGTWAPNVRQLFQESDFHFIKGKIFRRSDPIADAYDGRVGRDIIDADKDELKAFCESLKDRADVQQFIREHEELFDDPDESEDALDYADHGMDFDRLSSEGDVDEGTDEFDECEVDPSMFDFVSLNSKMCGLGYRAPRDRYEFRNNRENPYATIAALDRKTHHADLMAELKDITDEEILDAFLTRIRDDYYADKEIRQQWNDNAFKIDRSLYQDGLRRRGLDEETIRRLLAWAFDNKKMELPKMFTIKDGKRIKVEVSNKQRDRIRNSRDSLWCRKRSEAYTELTLTFAQWSDIYTLARTKRAEIREMDKRITSKSYSYKRTIEGYIEKVNHSTHIRALCVILEKHNAKLIPTHRRTLWNLLRNKAQAFGWSYVNAARLSSVQIVESAQSVDILSLYHRISTQQNPFKIWQ